MADGESSGKEAPAGGANTTAAGAEEATATGASTVDKAEDNKAAKRRKKEAKNAAKTRRRYEMEAEEDRKDSLTYPITETLTKAFDFCADTTKQLITLSTAIVALTITFMKDVFSGTVPEDAKYWLIRSWGVYLASVFFGLWTMYALTGMLARRQQRKPKLFNGSITLPSLLQILTFLLATAFIGMAGYHLVTRGSGTTLKPEQLVEKVHSELVKSLNPDDLRALERLVDNELRFTNVLGRTISKTEIVVGMQSGVLRVENVEIYDVTRHVYGEVVIETGRAIAKGNFGSESFDGQYHFTAGYMKRQSGWQLITLQTTQAAQ
jgi:hypothetical protein